MWIGLCFFDVFEPLDSKNAFFLGKKVDPEFPNVDHIVSFNVFEDVDSKNAFFLGKKVDPDFPNVDPEFPNVDRTVFFRCF